MTRQALLVLMMIALPTLRTSAQAPVPPAIVHAGDRLQLSAVADLVAAATPGQAARQAARQPPQAPPPPPPPDTPRRRGSMVGYIEDPVVGSKVRIRFDGGWHNPTPDRAEFFYAKCGCYANAPLQGTPNYDPQSPGPGPGAASDVNFKQLYLMGEVAMSDQFSVFAEVPFRWLQPQAFLPDTGGPFGDQSGLSDVRAGARLGLSAEPGQALTAQVKVFLPTGDAGKGLGTDHWSIEPAFLFYREVSQRVTVEGQVAAWAPIGGSAGLPTASDQKFSGRVLSYGIGPSFAVYQTERVRVAPVVELVGWHVFDGFETSPTNTEAEPNTVNLKIGGRVSWTPLAKGAAGSIYVGYGKALTDAKWYDDILRVEYRVAF